jgi:RimJ/RimL family protein N-acetyltransferase
VPDGAGKDATPRIALRDATEADVPIFFEHQLDPVANAMAAFTARDPTDRVAFFAHWSRLLADTTLVKKAILAQDVVVGHLLGFEQAGRPAVGYWIAREHWGRGIASEALTQFLAAKRARPIFARAAKDNAASIRVLEKCGFRRIGEDVGYSYARGRDVEEFIFELSRSETPGAARRTGA